MMAAILMPVALIAGSLLLDTTNALSMKTRLQNAVDSAALATATRLYQEEYPSISEAEAFAVTFLKGQIEEDSAAFAGFSVVPSVLIVPVKENESTLWQVAVTATGTQNATSMASLIGRGTLSVNVTGKSESGSEASSQGPISLALVLDKSGSMASMLDGDQKIRVLKTAVFGMIDQFKAVDKKGEYIRLGAVSYNSSVADKNNLTWKIDQVHSFVDRLQAKGATDSTGAFRWAYENVSSPTEINEHKAKTGQEPERIIVFMTDGENNHNSADTSTKKLCDQAKADGLTVYTIAFAAPKRGQILLSYCASKPENYYDARNSAELIGAFKNIGEQTAKVVTRLTE